MTKNQHIDSIDSPFVLYLISCNSLLKERLQKIDSIDNVVFLNSLEEGIHCKAILVDGEHIKPNEVNDIRKTYPNIPIFYRLYNISNQLQVKTIEATFGAYTIHSISEHYSIEQVALHMEYELFSKESQKKKRIISFFGTHSGAGVSTTVLNVADVLAQKTSEKVLVLSLNPWDPSDYFLQYDAHYLNDIKIELHTNSLTEEKLLGAVMKYENFYHLAGNRDIKMQRYYTPDEIELLLQVAQRTFDIILIDAGTHFDNAAYAQSYKSADLKFLITTQEPKGFRGYWPHIFNQLIEPIGGSPEEFLLIVNQYTADMALMSEKDLAEELQMNLLVTIPNELYYGPTAIAQKKLLHEIASDKSYIQSLEIIANSIISRAKLNLKPGVMIASTAKRGLFSKLLKRESNENIG